VCELISSFSESISYMYTIGVDNLKLHDLTQYTSSLYLPSLLAIVVATIVYAIEILTIAAHRIANN
jgi:hypothetical protein